MDGRRASRAILRVTRAKIYMKSSVDYSSSMSYGVEDILALVSFQRKSNGDFPSLLKHPVAFWAVLSAPSGKPPPAWLGYKFRVDNTDIASIQFRPIRVCSPI